MHRLDSKPELRVVVRKIRCLSPPEARRVVAWLARRCVSDIVDQLESHEADGVRAALADLESSKPAGSAALRAIAERYDDEYLDLLDARGGTDKRVTLLFRVARALAGLVFAGGTAEQSSLEAVYEFSFARVIEPHEIDAALSVPAADD